MKKILFLTGTRADFGKLKPLMQAVDVDPRFEMKIFATGMHMLSRYGLTVNEIRKCNFSSIYTYINQRAGDTMDIVLAKTIVGLSDYIKEDVPDLIVVHGDRVEALAGSVVGSLNNILVAHVEGGEVSGTIDELIRHSVSKMSHLHFVSNNEARDRLLQMGEDEDSVAVIGSPDLDIMSSDKLPTLAEVKSKYGLHFDQYGIFMFHPVTTEVASLPQHIEHVISSLLQSDQNFVVIYPNNDHGSEIILAELQRLEGNPRFRIFPSIRFECFLTLLKHALFMIGNSSAGVREAPFYGVPSINIGSRQNGRANAPSIANVDPECSAISEAIRSLDKLSRERTAEFGEGNSAQLFAAALADERFWQVSRQKMFIQR